LKGLLEPNPRDRWTLDEVKGSKWYTGKTIPQDLVGFKLRKRKKEVDAKKFKEMSKGKNVIRRVHNPFDLFSQELPQPWFKSSPPPFSFVTTLKPEWALEEISKTLDRIRGATVTERNKDNFMLSFHVVRRIDSGKVNKETKEKIYLKLKINVDVQMWLMPGQEQAIADQKMNLAALKSTDEKGQCTESDKDEVHEGPETRSKYENGQSTEADIEQALADQEPLATVESMDENGQLTDAEEKQQGPHKLKIEEKFKLKYYAVFMAEGGGCGLKKYHFRDVYEHILKSLPHDIIAHDGTENQE